jgi:signal recognition particle receptor subunit alpha
LDFSNSAQNAETVNADMIGTSLGNIKDGVYEALELQPSKPKSSFLADLITNFTVGKPLTEEMLKVPIQKIREHLIEKNVSAHVSESITESAKKNLVGTKLKTLESVNDLIRKQLSIHISKILTPQVSTDLIKEIKESNSSRDIYSICFIGVNGVGKSTNLSKVCFWLLQNNLKILIAACDTFRSGAVEQLKVHVSNLSKLTTSSGLVDLFDRGYGKDPAGIAKEAIAYGNLYLNKGKNNGYDVILIDTAGRMQDNEPLMRALTKLVTVNNPNKIIFVGEALVGNEGLDQITKFNQALKDFSGRDDFRLIDGMILTKFDTVDDKVGTALTMSYQTGKPIFFVGDGQTYTDLRKLNVENIVSTLLS